MTSLRARFVLSFRGQRSDREISQVGQYDSSFNAHLFKGFQNTTPEKNAALRT
jgi:hypothetical protein